MDSLTQLWMPILATAVLIFIASSVIHMVFKWHNSDYKKLSNEDDVRAVVRAVSPPPGQYVIPHCEHGPEMGSEAMQQKFREGPVAFMTVKANGMPNMGTYLGGWFVFVLVVAALAGCLAMCALPAGKEHAQRAGHLVGMISFLTYFGGSVQMAIWMGKPWSTVFKDLLDSVIYGVISALVFWWLWP
ncbi:MAG: hypothetical protein ABI905_17790 [Betaproteobacteria bacterium]